MTLEKDAEVGRQAEMLLDNPIYKDSIAAVQSAIITAWQASPIRDKEGQHELKLMLKLLGDLEANIKRVAETGKLAKLQIEQEKRGLKSFFRVA
jgi:hypothetical protein